jgi:hypothetical protein
MWPALAHSLQNGSISNCAALFFPHLRPYSVRLEGVAFEYLCDCIGFIVLEQPLDSDPCWLKGLHVNAY